MNAPAPFPERVHAYLDGLLSEAETAALFGEIRASPEAARAFARLTRFESDLEQVLLGTAPVPLPFETREAGPAAADPGASWWRRRGQPALDHAWGPAGAVLLHAALLLLILRWAVPFPREAPDRTLAVSLQPRPEGIDRMDPRDPETRIRERMFPPAQDMAWTKPRRDFGQQDDVDALLGAPGAPSPPVFRRLGQAGFGEAARGIPMEGVADSLPDAVIPVTVLFAGRTAEGRAERHAIAAPGWGLAAEHAARAGLAWLSARGTEEGAETGEPARRAALTAAACLALGPVPTDPEGQTARQALRHLLSRQQDDGRFDPDPGTHALATLALAEARAMWRIPGEEEALRLAVESLLSIEPDAPARTAADSARALADTAWQAHALALLIRLHPDREDLRLAAARLVARLKTLHDPATGVFQSPGAPPGARDRMTAAAVSALNILGESRSPESARGRRRLLRHPPERLAVELARESPEHLFFLFDALAGRPRADSANRIAAAAAGVRGLQADSGAWPGATGRPDAWHTAAAAAALTAHLRHPPDRFAQAGRDRIPFLLAFRPARF